MEFPCLRLQVDLPAPRLLDPVRVDVDVLLDLPGERFVFRWEEPPQAADKDVQLLQIRILEREDLGEERV